MVSHLDLCFFDKTTQNRHLFELLECEFRHACVKQHIGDIYNAEIFTGGSTEKK